MELEVDPLSHVAARFSHALMMLCELIPFTTDDALPTVAQIACLEDWFTNYRLLIEFLVLKPAKNCASARSFVPGWKPVKHANLEALRKDYGWASEDVSHIGHLSKVDRGPTDPDTLRAKARSLLVVAAEFSSALKVTESEFEPMVAIALRSARESLGSS